MAERFDDVVKKSPTDRRLYRILHLPNQLCALLIHDPEIYPDGLDLPHEGAVEEDDSMEECEEDDDGDCDGDEDDEEYESDEEEEEDESDKGEEDGEDEGDEGQSMTKSKGKLSQTKKAAAAMCVGVGSFSDPYNAQGLAHFLEHMLFMGSKEFPDENEYDSYVSKHGGSTNAYTETEYTCYHFEISREYLKGALKRFSQLFISPLMKVEAMEREILAVDSEFNQVLQSDNARLQQLHCQVSTPGHLFNRFCWGNKKSLMDAMEHGVNLREEISKMYMENYHAGIMKLVVIGGEPLDVLEDWIVELFSNVKAGPSLRTNYKTDVPIWKVGKLYRLEAVKDVHVLELAWTLPCLHNEYLKKPEDYLAHLLGHEGRGSLLYLLKSKGLASALSAGVGEEGMSRSSIAYIFVMSIYLTDSGLEKFDEVIGFVYQYIKLLRQTSPQEWVFKELQDIGNMDFRFAEEQPQDDYAVNLAENFFFYSKEHIICGEYAFEQWDPELVQNILNLFSPENMRVVVLSKSFDKQSQAIQYEPWFGSRYIEEDISPSLLKLWGNPLEIAPSLHLPSRNDFIPSDFSLRNANMPKSLSNISCPQCIIDNPLMKLWYKMDTTFNVPRANVYFLITVKDGYSSVKNCVLTELFINLLKDELNEIIYQAGVAKLETSLSFVGDKLELKLSGFSDKLPILLSKILNLSKTFTPNNDRFKVIKEDMERKFRNYNMKPLSHSSYLRIELLRRRFWGVEDKLSCLLHLTLSDLIEFIPRLLSQLYIEGLCHGNLSEKEAIEISNIFTDTFSVEPIPAELRHKESVMCFPSSSNLIRSVLVKNAQEVNSVAELYFQIEQDVGIEATRLRAITDLFSNIIEEPCFNQLRTKEQLGYVVECGPRMTYRVLGYCFRVQSSEYNPIHLHGRIDNFINGLRDLLESLDDESFESHRSGLIAEKLEKDPSLLYETGNYWDQIVDKRYLFDILKLEAEELKSIKKSEIIDWFNEYLRPESSKCRRLAVHVWGSRTNYKEEAMLLGKLGEVIEDVDLLKSTSNFYSSIC
ncbi:nardilysin-like [Curcuma longa]|uniref:nardilysin-like n=1 Tax=Curcuma longa TaxID=136217 RepID=UPI003D9EF513